MQHRVQGWVYLMRPAVWFVNVHAWESWFTNIGWSKEHIHFSVYFLANFFTFGKLSFRDQLTANRSSVDCMLLQIKWQGHLRKLNWSFVFFIVRTTKINHYARVLVGCTTVLSLPTPGVFHRLMLAWRTTLSYWTPCVTCRTMLDRFIISVSLLTS